MQDAVQNHDAVTPERIAHRVVGGHASTTPAATTAAIPALAPALAYLAPAPAPAPANPTVPATADAAATPDVTGASWGHNSAHRFRDNSWTCSHRGTSMALRVSCRWRGVE
jgi:hypothetical protein